MIRYLNKTVGELMTRELISVTPNTIMAEVAKIFKANHFHHLPVIDREEKCVGVISKMDYYQLQDSFTRLDGSKCDAKNLKFLSSLLAKEIMSPNPICIEHNVDISDVIPVFLANTARSAIIIKNEKSVGIITPLDLLEYMQEILVSYQKAIV